MVLLCVFEQIRMLEHFLKDAVNGVVMLKIKSALKSQE